MTPDRQNELAGKNSLVLTAVRHLCENSAIAVLLFMMCLTCVDIIARYFFNSPIRGAFELTQVSLASLVFLSLPVAMLNDGHIKVDLIGEFRRGIVRMAVKAVSFFIALSIFTALTVELFKHTLKIKGYGQVTNSLEIPLYWVGSLAALCCLLCVIVLIVKTFDSIKPHRQ